MSKTNSIIEVNGHRYDALTGQILEVGDKMRQGTRASKKRVIDGFVMGAHHTRTKLVAKNVSKSTPKNPAQNLHGRPQRAKTLVRGAVRKPSGTATQSYPQKHQAHKIDPIRDLRAKTIIKHEAVKRFGHFMPRSQQMDVSRVKASSNHITPHAEVMTIPPVLPSTITSVSHNKLERMLDEALVKADAHKHMMNEKKSTGLLARVRMAPRWLSIGVITLVLGAAAFIIVWRNLPAVAVHVAAVKAGVHATMPAYTPAGFSYANMQYVPGAITMQYNAKAEPEQKFVITQQTSDWNSTSLAANALPKDANVETSDVNGTTVYIYGDSNDATWVNNHVRYSLKNQAKLTSDQVLRIAKSL